MILDEVQTGVGRSGAFFAWERLGVKPEINAVCTIMIVVVALGLIVASLLTKRSASRSLGARM